MKRNLVLVACLALAACGGSSQRASAPVTVPQRSPSSQSTPATTQASTPTATTPAQSAPALCRAGDLSLSYLGGQGATGHGELGFELRNTSSRTCATGGYPGVLFLSQSGSAMPTAPDHTTHDYFGTIKSSALSLAPGQAASFRLGVTHGMTSTAGCGTAYGLQVIPPNDTSTLRVTIAGGGAYECRTVSVSPLATGTSAYP